MNRETRLALEERRLAAMRERVLTTVSIGVEELAAHLEVSRSTVESYPEEITRRFNATPGSTRRRFRFSPMEVEAIKVRLRRWERAKAEGRGDEYLESLRAEMRQEEDDALARARDARKLFTGEAA